MLSQKTVSYFQTFGFVVLRGLLSEAEVAQLREETSFAMTDVYGDRFQDKTIMVTDEPAYGLPMMTEETPFASRLVADDPRFWQSSHHLMGTATVPSNGAATCFRANARWHADMASTAKGVKFMTYLDGCSPETGLFQVLPGSHIAGATTRLSGYIRQDPCRQGFLDEPEDWPIPAYSVNTQPGDVIAFHTNLLHASRGGDLRMAWDVNYFPDPILEKVEQREITRDAILHIGDYTGQGLDHEKWPVWRDWAKPNHASVVRQTAINRLRRLGVLETEGAESGTPQWVPRLPSPSAVWMSGAPPRKRSVK
ncbi:phytanoyl-CoA dioxygenase family protein [Amycolatopsis keratiniphila]|uniref:phytanoyl-CoA dioxygenase family protein n=1 Tax=Amycolatopsis keratiniphila TaxID=129921 RepID=UPI0033D218AC